MLNERQRAEFDQLSRGCYASILKRAWYLTKNREDAHDLTQEAFRRAAQGFGRYDDTSSFSGWVYRIVTNLYLDLKRNRSRRVIAMSYDAFDANTTEGLSFDVPDGQPSPLDEAMLTETLGGVAEVLETLPAPVRDTMLRYIAGENSEELEVSMGIPAGTVRSRINRARTRLKEAVTNYPALAG